MNFLRCKTVAWAEHRIHFRLSPRNLLLLHSKHILTFRRGEEEAQKTHNLIIYTAIPDLMQCHLRKGRSKPNLTGSRTAGAPL